MKIVLVTGGFDPLHSGHIEYFREAKKLGDILVVGLNSDEWLARKKGQPFMPWEERASIVGALSDVDRVINFNDIDNSAKDAIRKTSEIYRGHHIIFANGGDRNKDNVPEKVFDDVEFVFGVGGENKKNSSSWLLREWKNPKTLRDWGYYRILHEVEGCKVKELTIDPGKSLSMQKHEYRSEYWFVAEGACQVKTDSMNLQVFAHDEMIKIPVSHWHQLSNPYTEPCRIIEIQYGLKCIEEDIERKQ